MRSLFAPADTSVCFCLFVCLQKRALLCGRSCLILLCAFFFSLLLCALTSLCALRCASVLCIDARLFVHVCLRVCVDTKMIIFLSCGHSFVQSIRFSFHTLIVRLFISSRLCFSALVRCGGCASENMSYRDKKSKQHFFFVLLLLRPPSPSTTV